ncbi:MAG TPA: hypothetical protein VER04_15895 [Polyangiaceae bacterium]|nr:hypothetical protein [Polyangiaceae bacterium]
MAEIVLDANVIVAVLYADDSQHQRAVQLTERLEAEGAQRRPDRFSRFRGLVGPLQTCCTTKDRTTESGCGRSNDAALA